MKSLSLRHSSYRRKLFVVVVKPVRPARSRRRSLLVRGHRGPQRPENDPVDHFQRGRAGRPRSGLPPQREFEGSALIVTSSNFCLCKLSIRVQYKQHTQVRGRAAQQTENRAAIPKNPADGWSSLLVPDSGWIFHWPRRLFTAPMAKLAETV